MALYTFMGALHLYYGQSKCQTLYRTKIRSFLDLKGLIVVYCACRISSGTKHIR